MDIYVIDTEGGKSLIVVSPAGESMLVDAGFPTANGRDTNRIVAAAQALGIKEFDHVLVTHYDGDHVGNIPNLCAKIPGKVYYDHGALLPTTKEPDVSQNYPPYIKFIEGKKTRHCEARRHDSAQGRADHGPSPPPARRSPSPCPAPGSPIPSRRALRPGPSTRMTMSARSGCITNMASSACWTWRTSCRWSSAS